MNSTFTRRQFLTHAARGAAGTFFIAKSGFAKVSPNSKLNIGAIGVGGRGGEDLAGVSSENIAAICDVDAKTLSAAALKHPGAATYYDYRRLIDRDDLDAIVVGTPDHVHAVQAAAALRTGRHVYCEKPLTRTISEARIVTALAAKQKRVTQIGTQIHAGGNYRRAVEIVRSGVLGDVTEVHVWVAATYGGKDLPKDRPLVPVHLHYDLWLGPVPFVPYHPEWVPFRWRNWWAFGGGSLADFGCHYLDLPFWALDLRYPLSAEVIDGPPVHPDSTPPWLIVRYEFPARGVQPPLNLIWYHGGKKPAELREDLRDKWGSGVLFMGQHGQLLADYGRHLLLPEKQFESWIRPRASLPDSIGHHQEWIEACKNGGSTTCSFDYSGPLTEAALLGNVAYRCGCRIDWDHKNLRARNCPDADRFIQHQYREGWTL